MNYTEKCQHCGRTSTCYTHSLNKPLVYGLSKLVDFYENNKRAANLQDDLKLDVNLNANFQKLQYFDLVLRTPDGWFPTEFGIKFIYGEAFAPNFVATIDSIAIPRDHPAWKTHDGEQVYIHIRDIDETSWKKRPEYQTEKKQAGLF